MRQDRALLSDAGGLRAAGAEDRRSAAGELAGLLGSAWAAEEPSLAEDALPLLHLPTGLRFVAVPGGRFDMGLTEEDLEEAADHVDWTSQTASTVAAFLQHARPVHPVEVRPFLVSRGLVTDVDLVRRLSGGRLASDCFSRDEARWLARSSGFRLPSEAEIEWLARDGGRCHFTLDIARRKEQGSRFGIEQIFWGEWAEDDWHPTYDGAPDVSAAWYDGDACGVFRGSATPEEMQCPEELLFMLAAVRGQGDRLPAFTGMRLVLDLPG